MAELKYVDWDGLVYYDGKIKEYIKDRDETYVKMGGLVSFKELPDPSYSNLHNIYKITDSFTSNNRFEFPGYVYAEDTWVICVDLKDDASKYRYVVLNEEDVDPDLSDYCTKTEVSEKIEDALNSIIIIPEVDLTDYYTKEEVDNLIPETDMFVSEDTLKETLGSYVLESELDQYKEDVADVSASLEDKADKTELAPIQQQSANNEVKILQIDSELVDITSQLKNIPNLYATTDALKEVASSIPSLDDYLTEVPAEYVTESELEAKGFLTEHQDISGKSDVGHKHDDLYDVKGAALEAATQVKNELLGGAGEAYDTLKELAQLIDDNTDALDILEKVATNKADTAYVDEKVAGVKVPTKVSELENNVGFITLQDIPEEYITESELKEAISNIEHPSIDLEDYATLDYVNKELASIIVPEKVSQLENDARYVTLADIPELETEIYKVDFNAPDFAAAADAYNNGKLLVLTNAAPDPDSFAIMNYARADLITFTKFLTSRSEAYGAFNTYYLHANNTWEVSKEVILNKVEGNVEEEATTDLTRIRIGKNVYSIPDTRDFITMSDVEGKGYLTSVPEEFATKEFVTSAISGIEFPEVPTKVSQLENDAKYLTEHQALSDYAKKDEVFSGDYNDLTNKPEIPSIDSLATKADLNAIDAKIPTDYLTSIPEEYVTEEELTNKGYITEHQSLDNYYTQAQTNAAIAEAIQGIEIPEVDSELYATKTWVAEQVATKADNVPFTVDTFVTNPFGEFLAEDNLKGLTITEILTKLLGLKTRVKYSIKFYVDNVLYVEQSYEEGDTIILPTPPAKEGYEFDGWKVDGIYITSSSTMPAYDVEAHAYFNELPEEPESVVDKILQEETPMYSIINNGGELVVSEVPFTSYTYTAEEGGKDIAQSGFYQIVDSDGNVIESGYQDIQISDDDAFYLFALPKYVDFDSMVTVKIYSTLGSGEWVEANSQELKTLTSDRNYIESVCSEEPPIDISAIDPEMYTLYMIEEAPNGKHFRFMIKEN